MLPSHLLVVIAVLLTLIVAWAYFTAQRLNRLHIRTDAARASLRAALDRRLAVVAAIVPEIAGVAAQAEEVGIDTSAAMERRASAEREVAENVAKASVAKAGVAKESLPGQIENAHARAVAEADLRVKFARQFYNAAVRDTRALRLRPMVRILRLGGTAPMPEPWDCEVESFAEVLSAGR